MQTMLGLMTVKRILARVMRGRVGALIFGAIAVGYALNPAVGQAAKESPLLSEIRLGAFHHDAGVFGRNEESGADGNVEVLFGSPDILAAIWSPRPHLGLTVNSDGGMVCLTVV